MIFLNKFAALVAHPLVRATCEVLNVEIAHSAVATVANLLRERFTDHSQRLTEALQRATDRAWKTLEIALAGKSFTQRLARAEDAAFRSQVESFLASLPADFVQDKDDFRQNCLVEARRGRSEGLLSEHPDGDACVEEINTFVRFAAPAEALEAEWRALGAVSEILSQNSYPNLGKLLKIRPQNGQSILVVAVRYFFRQQVIKDEVLHREHVFSQLSRIKESQDTHFFRLESLLTTQGHRFEESIGALAGEMSVVIQQMAALQSGVDRLLQFHHLGGRPLSSKDSFSNRDDTEREQIRELRKAFRGLPPEKRQQLPALLRDLGKLTAVGGDFEAAEHDFKELAATVTSDGDKAEAWYNAYQVALQQRDWARAFEHFQLVCQLQASRYAPFPLERYAPSRILGAGGFGVAFLCTDRNLQRTVVVKALQADTLAGNDESLLAEARALMQVKHPGIVELFDCDHADRATRARPYLVMEYFENSLTLEEHILRNGPLPEGDVLAIVQTAGNALQVAHDQGIYHRDIKPGNLLVRKTISGWETKLIDFGLAIKQELIDGVQLSSSRSILGASVAGTAEYAAPEQMGRLTNVPVGAYSDVYGLGKTCCYAMFGTTRPLRKHWAKVEQHLLDPLERATDDNPHERPQTIKEFLQDIANPTANRVSLVPVLTAFHNRLSASVSRSPLLKVSITKRGNMFDLSQLTSLDSGLPGRVVTAVQLGKSITLDLRPKPSILHDTAAIFDLLVRKISRAAELAKRETGVHALWLGYPLVTASKADKSVRAPLFLWPIAIEPEGRREMHLRVSGLGDLGIRFNRTLAMWIHRELGIKLQPPSEENLTAEAPAQWREVLQQVWPDLDAHHLFDFANPLQVLPQEVSAAPPQLLHACALGYFTWQNESLQEDMERLLNQQQLRGVLAGILSSTGLARPAEEKAPAEKHRYLVSESDYSQEQVVWQARSGPGLVVHGPPGTGKSQTIVNVIADALAHERTVLMVCQKQAATRVVFERLRAAGLSDLCLEIHDAEQDRKSVFAAIRQQVDICQAARPQNFEQERAELAQQITEHERELDVFASAFHSIRPRYGMSYRDMKALEHRQQSEFPSVRPLEKLRALATGFSLSSLEEATRRTREVGSWFAEGRPLHNPWSSGHLEHLRHSGNLREQIHPILAQLRSLDVEHQDMIREHETVLSIPTELRQFMSVGEEVLGALNPHLASPGSILQRWLRAVKTLTPEGSEQIQSRIHRAAKLGHQARATPLVPFWEEVALIEPDFTTVAEEVRRHLASIHAATVDGKQLMSSHWLRALRNNPAQLTAFQASCQQAEQLADQLNKYPADPYWSSVEASVLDFQKSVDEVLDRLGTLSSAVHSNQAIVTQHLLNQALQATPEVYQRLRDRCEMASRLATQLRGASTAVQAPSLDSEELTQAMSGLLEGIANWRQSGGKQQRELTLAWLNSLRGADDEELNECQTRCQQLSDLSRRAGDAKQEWEDTCSGWTAAQIEEMIGQSKTYLQQSRRLLSFLNGPYRQAKKQLSLLRPGAQGNALGTVASSFLEYAESRRTRDRFAIECRNLIPGYSGVLAMTFPRLAREALGLATSLIRLARAHREMGAVLDEIGQGQDEPGKAELALLARRDCSVAWQRLRDFNNKLFSGRASGMGPNSQLSFPGLALRGLDQAGWLISREKQHPHLRPLLDAFASTSNIEQAPTVQKYRRHVTHITIKRKLEQFCQDLIPAGPSPPATLSDLLAFPAAATRALESAAVVGSCLTHRPWLAPLVEEALSCQSVAAGGTLENLAAHLQGLSLRAELAKEIHHLVPGMPPPANEEDRLSLANVAWVEFQKATHLNQLAVSCEPARHALDQFLAAPDTISREKAIGDLRRKLDRGGLMRRISSALANLRAYLAEDELKKPLREAFAGRPLAPWANQLEEGMGGLQALINLDADRKARSGQVGEVLRALEEYEQLRQRGQRGPVPPDGFPAERHGEWWVALLFCSVVSEWQSRCREESPVLNRLTPEAHAARVKELKHLLDKKRRLEARVICQRWLVRQQRVASEPWGQMFPERKPRGGQSLSLRDAVDKSWDKGLSHLRPCWLVSPAVASQILPWQQGLFDLVIFDEASQCPVELAVPSIYRGKTLLVAGDEKQLPPTTFFAGAAMVETVSEAEDDEGENLDREADSREAEGARRKGRRTEDEVLTCTNLLELGISKLKQLYLSVHYRSDHPALIEFSNQAFYKGQLESPPAQKVSIEGDRPIEYHSIGGRFIDRTNPTEAEKVVEYLKQAWQQPNVGTFGVVTFNQAQRDLIADLIEKECHRDTPFQTNYQTQSQRREGDQDVGFFVKNLENVQGDERDVMIFSTAFGHNKEGKFYRRFGPVALVGGHRRLNVAVTRAKKRIVIMCSMPVGEVGGAPSQSGELTPAGYLQRYLEYAQAVSSGDEEACRRILVSLNRRPNHEQTKSDETPLEREVQQVLKQAGYGVVRGVGSGVFAIDLGVLHRNPQQGFVLGIDCDGGSHRAERPARIDEVWRAQVLARRGWGLHRVWSDSWRMNREAEIRRLLAALPAN